MLVFINASEMWGYHAANRAAVSSTVGMTANIFIYRAGIQAGAASDAIQGFPRFWISQQIGAAIIQQNYIHFFRPIRFAGLPRTCNNGVIRSHFLPGSKSGE